MKKYTLYILCAAFLCLICSCSESKRTATIEGNIADAEGQLLVLEHLGNGGPKMVDTLRLAADGHFSFAPEVEDGPDFFSLRIDQQSVSLAIDTLLTPVKVTAKLGNMANGYEVSDPVNQELKATILLGNQLRGQYVKVLQAYQQKQLSESACLDSLNRLVKAYKDKVWNEVIVVNPSSAASYYALFETIRGMKIFDASDAQDTRAFGAVATGWSFNYPNSPRNKELETITLEGQQVRRMARERALRNDSIVNTLIVERNYPEIVLPDTYDKNVALSSLVEPGKVVLIDFNAYFLTDVSPLHNMRLREVYDKYADKGLRIYQVCLDIDEHFWKTSADNLPWTTVRDADVAFDTNGTMYSSVAGLYNVQSLPTSFLLGGDGELKGRIEDDTKLAQEIQRLIQ